MQTENAEPKAEANAEPEKPDLNFWKDEAPKEAAPQEEKQEAKAEEPAKEEVAEAKEEPKKDDAFEKKFSELAKRERKLQEERKALQAEREVERAQKAEFEEWKRSVATAKADPESYLRRANLTYADLTQFYLNGAKPQEAKPDEAAVIKAELAELKKWREAQEETRRQQEAQAQRQTALTELSKELSAAGEKYELIQTRGAQEMVLERMSQMYQETGEVPDWSAAADEIETALEQEAERLLTAKKLRAKLSVVSPQKPASRPPVSEGQTTRTLTNRQAAAVSPPAQKRVLSDAEARAEAAAMIRWTDNG